MSPELRRLLRVSAYALCTDGDRILLCRIAAGVTDSADGMWTLPGGGLEHGEEPRKAAIRELAEETGLTGAVEHLLEVASYHATFMTPARGDPANALVAGDAVDYHGIQVIYRVRITGGELRDETAGSTDTCQWMERGEIESLPLVELARLGVRLAFPA